MITIDYMGRLGLEKAKKWLCNTWTAPKVYALNYSKSQGPLVNLVIR